MIKQQSCNPEVIETQQNYDIVIEVLSQCQQCLNLNVNLLIKQRSCIPGAHQPHECFISRLAVVYSQ